jgi:epoxyqueuosine reductase
MGSTHRRHRRRRNVRDAEAAGRRWADPRNPEYWLPGARSVVSFFLPFSRQVRKSYGKHARLPSLEWVSGRLNGKVFVNLARRALAAYLRAQGGRAMVPNLQPHYKAVNYIPMWSERHVAFIAGVGTFGLHAGLLTEKGAAGWIGSVVTDLELTPTPRRYSGVYDYCPWVTDSTCGAWGYHSCGHCQNNLPCTNGLPPGADRV